ncbi:hypothetical protein GCM10008170_03100 [Methylopila capsulata]|uniref:Uncharacterized protein n=1 Tax=Methylopila capsulata TaxID=61654 RepID=A0A9W6ISH4_9HYPH|nr:hypothetical protein GCM10008170_03100 [Methylopila capsulata]
MTVVSLVRVDTPWPQDFFGFSAFPAEAEIPRVSVIGAATGSFTFFGFLASLLPRFCALAMSFAPGAPAAGADRTSKTPPP